MPETTVDPMTKITADEDAQELSLKPDALYYGGKPLFTGENFSELCVLTKEEYNSRLRLGTISEHTLYLVYG